MKLESEIEEGDKYITVHHYPDRNVIFICGWMEDPENMRWVSDYQIGETIEL